MRIGGRLSIGVDRPAGGQRLAALGMAPKLDKGGRAGRLVDEERRAVRGRRGECDRGGAIDGVLAPATVISAGPLVAANATKPASASLRG